MESTASARIAGTAAGNLWDTFDQHTVAGLATAIPDLSQTGTPGDDVFMYTSPEFMEGLTATLSWEPQNTGIDSGTGWGINYTGVEGLTLQYAVTDVVGTTTLTSGDNTQMKATYAYGPVTVGYSVGDHDEETTNGSGDVEMTSMAVTYTVTMSFQLLTVKKTSEKGSFN